LQISFVACFFREPVKQHEAFHPPHIGLLGADAVVARADGRAQTVEQLWLVLDPP